MRITVSVIVATRNRPQRLDEALKSIHLQGAGVPFEVVVVNDAGIDVGDVVARWARVMPVQAVNLAAHAGLAAARNEGMGRARGDILCFLDDDDVLLAGHLRAGVGALRDDVDAVCVHVAVCDEFIDAGTVPLATQMKAHYRASFDDRLLMICNFLPVNSVFMRRPEVPALFDAGLSELEDWDLWLQLRRQRGYRFRTLPITTALYHRVWGFSTMTSRTREAADVALKFRDTFRQIASRYPSDDAIVRDGRALHDHFYAALARACSHGEPVHAFAYERLVECLAAFTSGAVSLEAARARIDSLVVAR